MILISTSIFSENRYLGPGGSRTPLHFDKCFTEAYNFYVIGDPNSPKEWFFIAHKGINIGINTIFNSISLLTLHYSFPYIWIDTEKFEKYVEEKQRNLHADDVWLNPYTIQKESGCSVIHYAQKLGDCVIVPPHVAHTVINKVTIKEIYVCLSHYYIS